MTIVGERKGEHEQNPEFPHPVSVQPHSCRPQFRVTPWIEVLKAAASTLSSARRNPRNRVMSALN